MNVNSLTHIAKIDELVGEGPFSLSADGVDLAVVRTGNGWRAFEGRCPHLGALLGEGELEDGHLICRNHRWRFSITSGRRVGGSECLSSCPIVERDGAVFADVSVFKQTHRLNIPTRRLEDLPGPRALPFIGNLHQLDPSSVHLILESWEAQYGSVFKFDMGPIHAIAVSDPRTIDQVLRARPDTFRRQSKMDRVLTEIGIQGVFNAEGEVWRPQRKLAVAALSQRHLRLVFSHIRTVTKRLHRRWQTFAAKGSSVDIVDDLKRFTVDITMLVAFGYDVNTVEQSEDTVQNHLKVIFPMIARRIFAFIPLWRFIKLPSDRSLEASLSEIRSWLSELLVAARQRAETSSERRDQSTFLDAMVAAVDEHGRAFSDAVIMSNLLTMVLAGEDTTAFSLAWTIHSLVDNPTWVEEVRCEGDSVLGDAVTAEDLETASKLEIAAAVANEAMRLRPVAPLGLFEANVDTVIGNVKVPRGTTVVILPRPAAVADDHFTDSRAFRPERWLKGLEGAHDLSAHIPFGSGPRMCPGRSLALIEMNTLLSMLYKNFYVDRIGVSDDVKELYGFTMSPIGLNVRLKERT